VSKICVPVKTVNGVGWGDLSVFCLTHEVVGETVTLLDQNFTFAGGHRVRKYKFKKNVHFKVPQGTALDISKVSAGPAPRKQGQT